MRKNYVLYLVFLLSIVLTSHSLVAQAPCTMPDCDPVPSEDVCSDGSDSVTLNCLSGSTNVIWYNSLGNQVGTGCSLIVDNTSVGTGAVGQSECFYYEALDSDGCPGVSCCPINLTVIACCVDPDPGTDGTYVICPGATVTEAELFAALGGTPESGGTWSPTPAGAGTYTYTLTGEPGCPSVSSEVIVTEVGPVILSLSATDPSCNGDNDGSIDATTAGGTGIVTFEWSTGATSEDISGLMAGMYSLTITDDNNCTATSSVTLTDPAILTCTTMHTDVTDCDADDGTITVTGSGGTPNYNYSQDGIVFTNTNTFTGLMAGNYTVYVEDANDCVSSCMATILAPTTPMCTINNVVNITCNGAATGSFDVSGSGGNGTYEFSEDNMTFNSTTSYTGLTAGSYIIYVRNQGQPNCVSMCNTLITEPDELDCVTSSMDVLCFGEMTGSIAVTASGGSGAYEYSNDGGATFQASNVFSNLSAGVYTITIRDVADNTCTHTCPAAITEPAMLQPTTSATDILCNGEATGAVDLDVTGGTLPLTYDWDMDGPDTPDDDDQDLTGLIAGTYTVTVTDANGCTVVATQVVAEPTALSCSTTKTDLSANGAGDGTATVTPSGGTPAYTYEWSEGQMTATASDLDAGMYTVTVTDMNGCTTTCDVVIEEPPCVQLAGEIFYDLNQNGCQDGGESLVTEGITVSLYECGDVPGTDVPAGITMIMDGSYEFGEESPDPGADICLEAGSSYFVVFDIPNGIGEQLEEYTFTSGTADEACETAGQSDDVNSPTGASACYDPDGEDDDENIDAGIVPPCEELAGEIFYDLNENGCEDAGEGLVMEPITVDLYPCGAVPGVDQPIATTTVSDGDYVFGENSTDLGADICLMAGTQYFVVFDIPNGAGEALEDYEFTLAVASGTCATNGESDNVDPATGASACYDPDDNDANGDDDQDIDAGIVPPCYEIAGEIFYDLDENGCEDAGETLVTVAVTVALYECGAVLGTDVPAATTVVNDGMYEFGEDSTDPGAAICLDGATEYFVVFDIPNGAGESLEEYTFTSGTADAACAATGESDDVNSMTGASDCYNPNDGDAGDGDEDQNVDAGIVPPCQEMAGEIFYDLDENGCQEAGENLVTDPVNVSLYTCGSTPGVDMPVASTTITDGDYVFGENSTDPGAVICLPAGTQYFVVFDIPNGAGETLEDYTFTSGVASGACGTSGESDDVSPTTGASACYDPDDGDAGDGDGDQDIDAGIVPPCHAVAGEIFYDLNENGCEDAGETLVTVAVTVALYECGAVPGTDAPAAMTVVNDGTYEFSENSTDPGAEICLGDATEYFVVFDIPNGAGESLEDYTFTSGAASASCESAGESDDLDPTTGQSACYNPNDGDAVDGDSDQNIDAGIVPPCESLAGEIFYDGNEDGCQDSGEALVMEAIDVTLYECGDIPGTDTPVASTTVIDGEYEFSAMSTDSGADVCLNAGTQYFVVFEIPNAAGEVLEDYEFTSGNASGACQTAGESDDVDPLTGESSCYDPDGEDDDEHIDVGIVPLCHQIAGEIFYDLNENGCQDPGEGLVTTGITVSLYTCGSTPGMDIPAAITMVMDGDYVFGENSTDPGADICLDAGTSYFVFFDIPNDIGEPLEEYSFTTGTADTACIGAGESDDVDPAAGATICVDPDNGDAGDGDTDEHLDAGIVPPCEELAGEIFYDLNENGCEDLGETLVMETVTVDLYPCGSVPGVDQPLATTTINDGQYVFGPNSTDPGAAVCLPAGSQYFVVFDIPNGAGETLDGYVFTSGIASGTCTTSGESDNVDDTTGASACYDPDDDDATDGDDDQDIDAGIVPPCHEFAGEIFYDLNENGCEDAGETLVTVAVTVSLYECGDTPGTDPPAAMTVVNDGTYEFGENSTDPGAAICLENGSQYFVVFDIPNGPGEILEDYSFTTGTATAGCSATGESDDVNPTTGESTCYDPNDMDPGDGAEDQHIDAGLVPPCESMAGEIFYDDNENGCQDSGEALVTAAIDVLLYECGDTPGTTPPFASTVVSDGSYEFSETSTDPGAAVCLDAGSQYFVLFDIPNASGEVLQDYAFTSGTASGACQTAGESDDVNPLTGASACYDPQGSDDDENIDAGIVPPCHGISGEIFYDLNENGCEDAGESLVTTAVTVSLYTCGSALTDPPAAMTVINDGTYSFSENSTDPGADICLDAGSSYFVVFDIPNAMGEILQDYTFTTGVANAACISAGESDDVGSTGASACYDPDNGDAVDGDSDENIDAGIVPPCHELAGEIFYDLNENGCEDAGEALVAEMVTVDLYPCGSTPGVDQPLATTTIMDGTYEFGENSTDPGAAICLPAGQQYFVAFTIPNGVGGTLEGYTFTTGVASGACTTAGESNNVDSDTGASTCYDPDDSDPTDGDDDQDIDAGIVPPCHGISGEIFYDFNENGCEDAGEGLVTVSVTISLYTCGQTPGVDLPAAMTIVNDGDYDFSEGSADPGAAICLDANTQYFVVFEIPNGAGQALEDYSFTTGTADSNCTTLGESDDVDPTNGASACYNPSNTDPTDGSSDENIDSGIVPPCEQLAGEIFYDLNDSGCEDNGETLVTEAITVDLYPCGSVLGVDQPFASTIITDGTYVFGSGSPDPGANVCLEAGSSYFVVFNMPNAPGEALEDYTFSSNVATGACAISGESDNVDPNTGASSCYDPDNSDPTDSADDEDIDAGIVPPCENMGGEVFYDGNENGCQDGNEGLVMEVINVSLYECGATPGVTPPVATTSITDGSYVFGVGSDDPGADVCLDAGTQYFVVYDIPMGAGQVLEGYEFTQGVAGTGCTVAGMSDDVDPSTGYSQCYDANDNDDDDHIDAGIKPPCERLAGEIFYDDNNNGCQDPGEPLVTGHTVEVVLYQCGDVPGIDQPAAFTTVTDGQYVFGLDSDDPGADICLGAGESYYVQLHIPNAQGESLEDYYFSENIATPSCLFTGEADNVDNLTGTSGCHDPSDTDSDDNDADENIDAGIVHPCEEMAGEIFHDENNNGCQDNGDALVTVPVNVSLYLCGDTPGVDNPVASMTTTDGTYQFGDYSVDYLDDPCLNPRLEYYVIFDMPLAAGQALEGHSLSSNTADAACVAGGEADDVDPNSASTYCTSPDFDDDDMDLDVGIYSCQAISGTVFYDYDDNGCEDGTDSPVSETVGVSLFQCSGGVASGGPIATTTTINGQYEFGLDSPNAGAVICLDPAQEYRVVFDMPNGAGESMEDYIFSSNEASPACQASGASDDVDPDTGGSACYNPYGDDDDMHIDAGVYPPYFDLMLIKQLATGQSSLVETGEVVEFELVITNLSSPFADNIVVQDIIPNGLSFDPVLNPFWTESGGTATTTLTAALGDLPAGGLGENQSTTVSIFLTVNHNVPQGTVMDNVATINGNDDNPANDTDNEKISTPITDLGIVKSLAAGQAPTVEPGDQVTYDITVTNNGTTHIQSAYLTDEYPFTYMTLNDPNWLPGMTQGFATHTATVDLDPGESYTISITFDVSMYSPGMTLVNKAQITMIFDEDNDPMVDNNPDNDRDDEPIGVANNLVYDMSLTKKVSSNTPYPHFFGSQIEFEVIVCNDGNTPISNFVITDELSAGFQFNTGHSGNAGWMPQGGGTYTYNITSIPMNTCVTLKMYCTVMNNGGPWTNDAVISSATTPNGTPISSTLDASGFANNLEGLDIEPTTPMGVIGSCVFKDLNGNGVRNTGEPGIAGIRVELYSGSGSLQSITTTDANGSYMFMDLFAGSYYVKFVLSNGYTFTTANQGNNDNNDSDVDGSNGAGTTAIINLGTNEMEMSIYAGLYRCVPFGDLIWFDHNGNNRQDPNENGINGVRVDIFRRTNGVWAKQLSTYSGHKPGTPSDDGYWKTCLPPGDYYVKFNVPSELKAAVPMIGGFMQDSDVTNAFGSNTTNVIEIVSCTENCHVDAGYSTDNGLMAPISTTTEAVMTEAELRARGSQEGSYNLIEWTHDSGSNSAMDIDHYEIARLNDKNEYLEIGLILSDDNTDIFNFEDYDILDNKVYKYRINQVDYDGKITGSQFVEIEVIEAEIELDLYPNPVSDNLTIELFTEVTVEEVRISLYDGAGTRVSDVILDFGLSKGRNRYDLDVSELNAGIYFLRGEVDAESFVKRVIVLDK